MEIKTMNINFKNVAKNVTTLAKIMENRDKIDTEEIISKYPDGFIIDEIEFVTMQKGNDTDEFWAFHIAGTNYFAFAGLVLNKIFNEYLKIMEGDYQALYSEFAQSGGIKVKLKSEISKSSKRPVTTVEVID